MGHAHAWRLFPLLNRPGVPAVREARISDAFTDEFKICQKLTMIELCVVQQGDEDLLQ
jgi:hypothetical protein